MGDHRFMYPKVTPYVPGGNRRGSHGDTKAPKAPIDLANSPDRDFRMHPDSARSEPQNILKKQ